MVRGARAHSRTQRRRPPRRAAIRRRAAPARARALSPARNCTALRRATRCVRKKRTREDAGARGGRERTASARLQPAVDADSHRQTLGRAHRPHRAQRKLYRAKQPPDPTLLRTSFSGYANFCFKLLKKYFHQFSWNWILCE